MTDVLFVLRGRPGLGHVTPGLAIAIELRRLGCSLGAVTYGPGLRFLATIEEPLFVETHAMDVSDAYADWPGLDLYNDGAQRLALIAQRSGAKLCVLGGEYMLPPLIRSLELKCALLFNPEIMEATSRNQISGNLFCELFGACDVLIPLVAPNPDRAPLAAFERLRSRLSPSGPFPLAQGSGSTTAAPTTRPARRTCRIVIANGGGISFPDSTRSYSDSNQNPAAWLEQTRSMTQLSLTAVLQHAQSADEVSVFSCLSDADNAALEKIAAAHARCCVTVASTSFAYYAAVANADLVISRAGAGFLADVEAFSAHAVIWSLAGHNEQAANARDCAARHSRVTHVETEAALATAIASALLPSATVARAPASLPTNARAVAEHLLAQIHA